MLDLVTGDCGENCCRVAARVLPGISRGFLCTYPLVDWLVCRVQASYGEYTAVVKCGKVQSYRGTGVYVGGAVKTDVVEGIM